MTKKQATKRIFNIVAAVIFIMGVAMFTYMAVADWLPALFLILGTALTVRQLLQGKTLDVIVCFVVFGGAFFCSFFHFLARIFLPTFLIIGGLYYLVRQFVEFGKSKPSTNDTSQDAKEFVEKKRQEQSL